MKSKGRFVWGAAILLVGVILGYAGAHARKSGFLGWQVSAADQVEAAGTSPDREELRRNIRVSVQDWYGLAENIKVDVGSVGDSHFPEFLTTKVTMDDGKNKREHPFYVSRDRRFLMENVFRLSANPQRDTMNSISLRGEISQGPSSARVTVVEYADLQCASCARFHRFVKDEFVPRYGNRVRVVYKEYPLAQVHDWALSGAIASQCVNRDDPQAVIRYRDLIFANQKLLTAANAREKLLELGEQAGTDRNRLARCLDTKATLSHVRRSLEEGRQLGVRSTPTVFINGKKLSGNATPALIFRLVDAELAKSK